MAFDASYFFTIVREKDFDQKVKKISKTRKRMAEFDMAVDWALSRKPHYFTNILGNYYLWVTEELISNDFPHVRILYSINESERIVNLIDIEEI